MRIIIATGIYPPDVGGPATYAQFLQDYKEEIGIEPIIVTYGKKEHNRDPRIHVISNSLPKGIRHIAYWNKLVELTKEKDILYAVDSSLGVAVIAQKVAAKVGATCIVRVTGDYAWEQSRQRFGVEEDIDEFQTRKHNVIVESFRKATHYAIRNADGVITPSEYLKKLTIGWGVHPKRVTVIPNPVTIYPLSSHARDGARKKLNVQGKKIIVSSGRFVPWKGFRELIQIFPDVRTSISNAQLILIGDGPERALLEEERAKNEAREAIRFTGSLKKPELIKWLSAADLFVLNSSYEGLSHQLIEAVGGFGLPSVVRDVGGNVEVQREFPDTIAFVSRHGSKELIKAIVDKLKENTIPIPPRKRAGKFSHALVIERLRDFFSNLVKL